MSFIRVTKKFASVLSKHQKLRIFQLAALMIFGGILEMCSVSLIVPFMNAVMSPEETMSKWYVKAVCDLFDLHSPRTFLVIVAFAFAFIYIFKNVYLLLEYNVQYRFVYGNMFAMQRRLLDNFVHRPYEHFLNVSSAEVIRIIANDTAVAFGLLTTLLTAFTELVVAAMLIVAIFVITPVITACLAGILIVLLAVINWFIKPIMRKAGLATQNSSAGMNKWLLQAIGGIKELKIMNKEKFFQEQYDEHGYKYVDSIRKNGVYGIIPRFFIEAICMSSLFLIVAFAIYKGAELESLVPMLSAVAVAAMRLLPSANRISSALASISYSEPMLDKMIENLKMVSGESEVSLAASDLVNEEVDDSYEELSFEREIKLDSITYKYPQGEKNILTDASMVIKKGEAVGVVGSTGSGKTTAIDVLLGMLEPLSGAVTVDGEDIKDNMRAWHDMIGYIPQSIFMLDDTIKGNVCFGIDEDDIDEERLWGALREASMEDFVKSLPDGVDTEIGERGVRLSGGQKQRIGIARALYLNPTILVFDEATSALDNETEAAIMESIDKLQGSKTMVIIAHRLTTIENCDHVYRVENEKIVKER